MITYPDHKIDGYVISKHETMLGWYERQDLTISSQQFDSDCWWYAYRKGYRKPNYPVPAIPLIVDINDDEITIWSDPVNIGPDLIEWRKALVTFSIYGEPVYL